MFVFTVTFVGEVVPAREGLRPLLDNKNTESLHIHVGEVVPAREGLRLPGNCSSEDELWSERLFQQEKD